MNQKLTIPRLLRRRSFWVNLLLLIGSLLIFIFGLRTFRSFQNLRYAQEQGLLDGTADPDAIRPWMTIQYIAVAYSVPEEYIFAELDIPFEKRNQHQTLNYLNQQYKLGEDPENKLIILTKIKEIILKYQENPVVTGLHKVAPWMSLQYISNSTGVPIERLQTELNIPVGNEFKPLSQLEKEFNRHQSREFRQTIELLLQQYEEEQ